MIKPTCDKCGGELVKFGGLVFSPPDTRPDGSPGPTVCKFHVCADCWERLLTWLSIDEPTAENA